MARFAIPEGWVAQAYRYALDPTPSPQRAFRSHAGGARRAHNTMLAVVKAIMDQRGAERSYGLAEEQLTPALNWSLAGLRKEWNRRKSEVAPWWAVNSKEASNTAWTPSPAGWTPGRGHAGGSGPEPGSGSRSSSRSGRGGRCGSPPGPSGSRPTATTSPCPGWGGSRRTSRRGNWPAASTPRSARILSATLGEDATGRWHVSLQTVVERAVRVPGHVGAGAGVVGVDVGVKADSLLVVATPDGSEVDRVPAPKSLSAAQARLRVLQRTAARQHGPYDAAAEAKRNPSKRWRKTRRRIGRSHAHAAAVRRDVLHTTTTALAQRHRVVTVETLNASGMRTAGGAHKRGLNRSLADAALAEVRRMLSYKTRWYGSTLVAADRCYPSSKTCSGCGRRKPNLTLVDRTYVCAPCGLTIDRDRNAAINLARLGDTQHTGDTRTGTGSSPAAHHRVGHGRGATHKTRPRASADGSRL